MLLPGDQLAILVTGAGCSLGRDAGLGALGADALDGRHGDVGVCGGQPRGLRVLGPGLRVSRLQSVGPAPPAAHDRGPPRSSELDRY